MLHLSKFESFGYGIEEISEDRYDKLFGAHTKPPFNAEELEKIIDEFKEKQNVYMMQFFYWNEKKNKPIRIDASFTKDTIFKIKSLAKCSTVIFSDKNDKKKRVTVLNKLQDDYYLVYTWIEGNEDDIDNCFFLCDEFENLIRCFNEIYENQRKISS